MRETESPTALSATTGRTSGSTPGYWGEVGEEEGGGEEKEEEERGRQRQMVGVQ
jgi:hypothetical protein